MRLLKFKLSSFFGTKLNVVFGTNLFYMKKISVFLFLFALLVFASCKKNKQASTTDTSTMTEVSAPAQGQRLPAVMPIDVNKDYAWPGKTDAFTFQDATIEGDKLTVKVKFGGGCKEHGFYLHNNMMWTKSLPPGTNLYMEHLANGDDCRALLEQTMTFDLTPVRYPGQSSVKLSLTNGIEIKELVYKY